MARTGDRGRPPPLIVSSLKLTRPAAKGCRAAVMPALPTVALLMHLKFAPFRPSRQATLGDTVGPKFLFVESTDRNTVI